jgi:ribosome-binding protein aMBF1 (putative translation factor)
MRLWLKVRILATYGKQKDFAKRIGMSEVWLSRIITGKVDPNDGERRLIGDMLGVEDYESLFIDNKSNVLSGN